MKREIDWSDGDPDVPILGFFLGATCIMCCFGFVLYWLMQPTVLPSKELVEAPLRPAAFVLAAAPSVDEDREKASLERANQENIEQGLKPPTVVAAHALEPKRESGAARSFKPKQVAKA